MPEAPVLTPNPAATVLVLRDSPRGPEVFMVRRHERTAFMGGAHVFPGGRVEPSDYDADQSWCDGITHAAGQLPAMAAAEAAAYHVAAARELFEEAGVLLVRDAHGEFVSLAGADPHTRFRQYREDVHRGTTTFRAMLEREGLRLALDSIVHFAHWVTPPVDTRRFDTRFFITRVPPHQTPAHDDTETTHSVWATAAAAIASASADEILLPPPTWTTLREIEPFTTVDAALAWARGRQVVRREPLAIERDGERMLLMPGDPLHPDAAADALAETRFVLKDRRWRAVKVVAALLLAASIAATPAGAQSRPLVDAAVAPIYQRLLAQIEKISIFDHHAHPGFADDEEVDPAPVPPGGGLPMPLRPTNPDWAAATRALFAPGGKPQFKAAHRGAAYFNAVLDRLGIETSVANRITMADYLDPARFKWVFYVDPVMYPFDNSALAARNGDMAAFMPNQTKLLKRFLEQSGANALPPNLAGYLAFVTRVLEDHKRRGAIAMKFEAAYFRSFVFDDPRREDAAAVYDTYRAAARRRPPSTRPSRISCFVFCSPRARG